MQSVAYFEDTYLAKIETEVLEAGQGEGSPWVALRECLFHPQGGGQPADRGWIGDVEITPVRDHDRGLIVARPAEGADETAFTGLAAGARVWARIDLPTRVEHAALHTAGHLIEAAGTAQGWVLAGNNHFPGQARIEFTVPTGDDRLADLAGREQVTDELRAAVAAAIAADLAVYAELDDAGRRIVHLDGLHQAPCGGTHVHSLADLAEVDLEVLKVKKGRIKVGYRASHRPLDARHTAGRVGARVAAR